MEDKQSEKKKNKGHMEREDVKHSRLQLADTILHPVDSL